MTVASSFIDKFSLVDKVDKFSWYPLSLPSSSLQAQHHAVALIC